MKLPLEVERVDDAEARAGDLAVLAPAVARRLPGVGDDDPVADRLDAVGAVARGQVRVHERVRRAVDLRHVLETMSTCSGADRPRRAAGGRRRWRSRGPCRPRPGCAKPSSASLLVMPLRQPRISPPMLAKMKLDAVLAAPPGRDEEVAGAAAGDAAGRLDDARERGVRRARRVDDRRGVRALIDRPPRRPGAGGQAPRVDQQRILPVGRDQCRVRRHDVAHYVLVTRCGDALAQPAPGSPTVTPTALSSAQRPALLRDAGSERGALRAEWAISFKWCCCPARAGRAPCPFGSVRRSCRADGACTCWRRWPVGVRRRRGDERRADGDRDGGDGGGRRNGGGVVMVSNPRRRPWEGPARTLGAS